jgi:hypothetical protein
MVARFRIPIPIVRRSPTDWQSLSSVRSRLNPGAINGVCVPSFRLLVQESEEMSLENSTLRSIWARPVLLRDELAEQYVSKSMRYLISALERLSARCSKAAGSPDRILRNGPQVAAHFVWLSGHVDDRCCKPRYGGPGRTGEGGWRAGLCAAGRQRRPCAGE